MPAIFLGAGASVPSGLPTFDQIWAAISPRIQRDPTPWGTPPDSTHPRIQQIVDLSGEDVSALGDLMVTSTAPTAAHLVAARVLRTGGPVLTVNWDDLVERACKSLSVEVHVLRPPEPICECALPHILKLHGEPHIAVPASAVGLSPEWADALPLLLAGRDVAVYGYSGRDGDVWRPLVTGLDGAISTNWFTLPDREEALRTVLSDEISSGRVFVHAAEDPAPMLEAWASAQGIKAGPDDPIPPGQASGTVALLTPRMWALIPLLASRPVEVTRMDDRAFEELVAVLLAEQGYDVLLTQRSKDGGVDVQARRWDPTLGNLNYLVQCKRHTTSNKVGVAPVRELFGLVSAGQVTGGLVVTSGFFTKGAKAFQDSVRNRLTLHDYNTLQSWLKASKP
ncbi:MAG: restriction endonuclease [Jatrophihabitantaceae bacterium]